MVPIAGNFRYLASPAQLHPSRDFHISKSYEKRDESNGPWQRSKEWDDVEKLSRNLKLDDPILFIDISYL
jgi:hypothetical protein